MKLANGKSWLKVILERNSLTTVNLINKEEIGNHLDKTLVVEDYRKLKDNMRLEFVHVFRKGKHMCGLYI